MPSHDAHVAFCFCSFPLCMCTRGRARGRLEEKPLLAEPSAIDLERPELPDEGPRSTGVRFKRCGRTKKTSLCLTGSRARQARCQSATLWATHASSLVVMLASGCRKVLNGICQECAAGYVHQQIPPLNIAKCFWCDDMPGWQDSSGLGCRDYESKGFCHGFVKAGYDEPLQGVRPSEACCACGGASVQHPPTSCP